LKKPLQKTECLTQTPNISWPNNYNFHHSKLKYGTQNPSRPARQILTHLSII